MYRVENPKRILFVLIMIIIIINISSAIAVKPPLPINKYLMPTGWYNLDRNLNFIDDKLETSTGIKTVYIIFEDKPLPIHEKLITQFGGKIIYKFKHVLNGFIVRISTGDLYRIYYALRYIDANNNGYSDLLYIQGSRIYKPFTFWATRLVDVRPRVWNLGYMGKGVRVAIMDTGIDLSTRGFNNSNIEFHDLINGQTTPSDEVGHGTMVSYIVAGNMTPDPSIGEGTNEILTTYIDYINPVQTDQYYYITGPLMVTGNATELKIYGMVVLYDSAAQGLSNFVDSAYLVHYPSYVIDDFGAYDQVWQLNIEYIPLGNGYYLANLTLPSPITNPPKGLYYIWVKFNSVALNYIAEVMGVAYLPIMNTDSYYLHSGVAPKAGLVVFKVGDSTGVDTSLVAQALDTIAGWNNDNDPNNDVNIASMSFGGPSDDAALHQAIQNAMNYGVLTVVAAGNDGAGSNNAGNTYPAAYPEVLTVTATNTIGNITDYSSQGGVSASDPNYVKPDVAAPGGSYYGPMSMKDSEGDGEVVFETGEKYEITSMDAQTSQGTSFATPVVSGLAALIIEVFKDKGVWSNDKFHVLLVKTIIEASTHETYPLIREKDPVNSPTLDRGGKDVHEGYGMIDGYAAIKLAEKVADLLKYWSGYTNSYEYDYGLDDNTAPFIEYIDTLRQGVLYGVSDINTLLNVPFGPSTTGIPVHFERYVWSISGTEYPSIYGIRVIAETSDPANTDFDAQVYIYNTSIYDVELLAHTNGGYGVTDEIMYFQPPSGETLNDYIYYVTVKRATEASAGGTAKLFIGPGLTAEFVNGQYIWINSTAASPNTTAPYALILIYYRNSTGTYIHREVIAKTSDLNGFAHVEGYIDVISGFPELSILERLDDDYTWFVGIIYTNQKVDLTNITTSNVVEGPIVVKVTIGEPTILTIDTRHVVLDHMKYNVTARLVLNDTGQPLVGRTILFYRSMDLVHWEYIGSNTTNSTGYAVFWDSWPINGSVYYLAVYPGDNTTQYTWTGYATYVHVYLETSTILAVSNTNPYTVEPVTITAKLVEYITGNPIPGYNVTIWISYDNGLTWSKLYSGVTDSNGEIHYTHLFLSTGTYMLKANFSGDPPHFVLESESSVTTISSQLTPTTIQYSINNTDLRVYDTIGFTIRLNYTYNTVTEPIVNAPVYLELLNNTVWEIVDTEYTDTLGYATLTYRFTKNGTYTFRIHYPGNNTFQEYFSDTITLLVKSLATTILLESVPSQGYTQTVLTATVRLIDEKNRPIAGETVILQKQVGTSWIDITSSITGGDGLATLSWSEDTAGTYTYRVVYNGKNYIYNATISSTFTVSVLVSSTGLTLTANTTRTYINETVQLIARLLYDSTPVSGRVIIFQVYLNGTWITLGNATTNSTGYAVFNTTMRYAGNYTYRAVFQGDNTYAPSTSNNVTVEYDPIPTRISLTAPSTVYTTKVFQVIIVLEKDTPYSGPVTGEPVKLWISSDGVTWSLIGEAYTDSTGTAVFELRIDAPGTYYLKANYSDPGKNTGEWEYSDSESLVSTITVILNTLTITLTVNNTSPYALETIEFQAYVVRNNDTQAVPDLEVELQVYNGTSWVTIATAQTNASGYAVFIISAGYVGNYTYRVYYPGSNIYDTATSNSVNVNVSAIPTTLELSGPSTVYANEEFQLIATLKNSLNNTGIPGYPVVFMRSTDGVTWSVIATVITDQNGVAVLSWKETSSGTYYYKAVFSDPGKINNTQVYSDSESTSIIVNVNVIPTTLVLTSNTSSTYVNEPVLLTAKLTMINGTPISGETIDFYIYNGQTEVLIGSAVTNSEGIAVLIVTSTTVGNYTYFAKYSGSPAYGASTSNNVTVEYAKRPVTIELVSITPSSPGVNDTITITVRVISLGEPLSVDLAFYNGSILVDTKTSNADGYAVFTITFTSVGVYNLSIQYSGSDIYEAAILNITVTIAYQVNLTLNITYTPLPNGSLLFKLVAKLYKEGEPFPGQRIDFYKKGSWIYIGSNTTDANGIAILYYIDNQPTLGNYTFKALYNSSQPIIQSAEILGTIEVKTILPAPEPPVLPLLLLTIFIVLAIYRKRRIK